jgi:uncharacterized membrane protein YdjX (TVP38/TMEM64 family)
MDSTTTTSDPKRKRIVSLLFFYGLTAIAIAGFVWALVAPKDFEGTRLWFQSVASPLGVLAPLAFVALQALQVVITPISHYAIGMLGGFLYGPYLGGLLNYIGRLIGHVVAFQIARKFGRPRVERYVDQSMIEKFDRYLAGKELDGFNAQSMVLFLIYFLPLFPDDEISYIVGLTKMKFWTFFMCNVLGHLGGAFSLAYLGSGKVSSSDPLFWILLVSTVIGAIGMLFISRRPTSANPGKAS